MNWPKINPSSAVGETAHVFRFWVVDPSTGNRVPHVLKVDRQLNAVSLDIDPERRIETAKGPSLVQVAPDGKKLEVRVPRELVDAHLRLTAGRPLDDRGQETIRLQYLAEIEQAKLDNPGCTDCELGAITRKYQDRMLAYGRAVKTSGLKAPVRRGTGAAAQA